MVNTVIEEDGSSITISCNVLGYNPEELFLHIEGETMVINGQFNQFNFVLNKNCEYVSSCVCPFNKLNPAYHI